MWAQPAAPGTFDGVQDGEPRGASTLDLLKEVTAHMRANGVRRVWVARGQLELEVELDPAAQLIDDGESEGQTDAEREKQLEEKRAKGLCVTPGCDKPGGHMNQPYCRQHFLTELNGVQTT